MNKVFNAIFSLQIELASTLLSYASWISILNCLQAPHVRTHSSRQIIVVSIHNWLQEVV